ncbi:long-chain-alcohol oxidase FAO4A-like [Olea europaea subsp. europaea]|uniref:Long-chain-alcohol oxidase FAO4A-like n=1 Tax=Olea europaea subsp. europaea TaxID=158383 RepID=A0A8S0TGJ5_OLEEU|nr:long-chain-alcohol oxidase FAO4A-like [Olea europaea subsp. europaea]
MSSSSCWFWIGVLAKAGYKVLDLEKGSYFSKKDLTLLEGLAMDQMFLGHGILATEDMDVLLLAGSTVGGGSTINWSVSFRTPAHILKEWSENNNLELFGSKLYKKPWILSAGKWEFNLKSKKKDSRA